MKIQLKKISFIITLICLFENAKAQNQALELLKAGQADAQKISDAYMQPILKAFGAGLNSGWYQTAKPLGLGGFSITLAGSVIIAPTEDRTYDVNNLGLTRTRLQDPSQNIAPTVLGNSKIGPKVEIFDKSPLTNNDTAILSFNLPQGIGNIAAMPTATVGVGVGLGTEVLVRFMPRVKLLGEASIGMLGFGVKHDIKQWIPVLEKTPFLDIAVMFAWNKMDAEIVAGNNALQPPIDQSIYNPNPNKDYSKQRIEFASTAWNTNLIVSAKFSVFTVHVSGGYQSSTTVMGFKGDFPVVVPNEEVLNVSDPSFGRPMKVQDISDPIETEGVFNVPRFGAGFRLKFVALTIHGDYNFVGPYRLATAGIGLNIQSLVPPMP
jgi:hypothetical protein